VQYPTTVKKAFHRIRYKATDAWQNLKQLRREIHCVLRHIDAVGSHVVRSRELLQRSALSARREERDL